MMQYHVILVFILGTLILMIFAFTLIIFLITHKKKQYQNLLDKQNLKNTYNNQLLQSRLEVQEQSFKYFSEEIHDNIGQLLSLVKMQLYFIKNNSEQPVILKKATEGTEILTKAMTGLRTISHTLNSAYIDKEGLHQTIEKDFEYIRSAKDIACSLVVTGDEYNLGKEEELLVFRIVQEAVSNAIKHGASTEIIITLGYHPEKFSAIIKDNGTGFDPVQLTSSGLGLNNMSVRASLLKGSLIVESEKEKGTEIILEMTRSLAGI